MRHLKRYLPCIFLTGALFSTVAISGCAVHARYYDAPHADYHVWGPGEVEPYGRWEAEGHRHHEDYNHLRKEDKQAYWNWRHDHK